ncbi:sigma-70 family RNA polymerase sigma factor [Amycolatopsis rhabdoformis]|uniref:Sigma-70 family RNA polymerase sigma factor n=1 Tax=Amycolatopsis rhabdoformis TaxID=1448059 RepID=A0ABZ1I1U7_9PSEU|nr:sigma-70 family RNA polymerase sigma factor [Amycolatopsis rhabdoformis]WSE27634.1 sigma-70 family RNA polymerase sigma factor [Amycolatopsis rhabdoformis]
MDEARLSNLVVRVVAADPGLRGDAEDACQAAWVEFLKQPGRVHDRARLGGWLATVARRHAIRTVQRRAREESLDVGPAAPASPEAAVVGDDVASALWRTVETLPDRHRRLILLLAHRPDLPVREMAAELGISPNSLAKLRSRSLAVLRYRLTAQGYGYP